MKRILYLLAIAVTVCSCEQPTALSNGNSLNKSELVQTEELISPDNLFILSDAEKILGEPAHLSDSTTTITPDVLTYLCAFTANHTDKKTGIVYFLYEKYNEITAAQKKYTFIKKANEDHGIKTLDDLGDEAYFHTDGENFYFIMVRKGNKVFNIKVNKITSKTSLDEFNLVAKKITDAL